MANLRHTAAFIPRAPATDASLTMGGEAVSDCTVEAGKRVYLNLQAESISHLDADISVYHAVSTGLITARSAASAIVQVTRDAPRLTPDCTFFWPYNRWNKIGHSTLNASTQVATFPATNTQKQQRSKIWRSTSRTAWIQSNLGNPYRINSVAIVSHNMSSTATFRVRVGNDSSMATTLYDSGTQRAWDATFATTGPMSEFADASGYPTDELIAFLRYCSERPRAVRWIVFHEVGAQYVRIDFSDPDNDDDFIEVAYIYAGLCIRVTPDQLYGWSIHPVGVSRVQTAASGDFWIDNLYRYNTASALYGVQPEVNMTAFWEFMISYLGLTREFIVAFQPNSLPKKFWYTMYAKLAEIPDLEKQAYKRGRLTLNVQELP